MRDERIEADRIMEGLASRAARRSRARNLASLATRAWHCLALREAAAKACRASMPSPLAIRLGPCL
jgi:hypothetical protein